jgi:hypothetical protein
MPPAACCLLPAFTILNVLLLLEQGCERAPEATGCCQYRSSAATFPFELMVAAGHYVLATAELDASARTISLTPTEPEVVGPFIGARYAWQAFPLCVVVNGAGMPLAPVVLAVTPAAG